MGMDKLFISSTKQQTKSALHVVLDIVTVVEDELIL